MLDSTSSSPFSPPTTTMQLLLQIGKALSGEGKFNATAWQPMRPFVMA
eukprot:CAMPEP_0172807136 /NCGR_PEP_ID=MMETSP1075-20121228/6805_1 /TAXON_ID=2916 /ORGANISM="Ceratium fusus, Strain PA161109" /LENGTH=47 /DNA_ID= /DNA_START= /DNA_END= /DNA_ORIENTATION=